MYGHREDSTSISEYPPHPHAHWHRADEDDGGVEVYLCGFQRDNYIVLLHMAAAFGLIGPGTR